MIFEGFTGKSKQNSSILVKFLENHPIYVWFSFDY